MNGLIRFLSSDLHAFEIAFFRNLFGFAVLVPLVLRAGVRSLATAKMHLHLVRGVMNAVTMLTFFVAVGITPLATVAALGFTSPLFATLFAALMLGETVGPRRVAGLAVGVVGGLVILRPGIATVGLGELLLLVSSIVWAVTLIDIKILARTETSLTTTVYGALFLIPITFAAALLFWRAPEPAELLVLLGVGALGSIGQVAVAQAFHEAEAAQVMPGDFTKLLFGSLIGFLFFAERPDIWTSGGRLAGLRQRRLHRLPRRPATSGRPPGQGAADWWRARPPSMLRRWKIDPSRPRARAGAAPAAARATTMAAASTRRSTGRSVSARRAASG